MGSVSNSTSDELHREADEITNPRKVLARREATAMGDSGSTPAAQPAGDMTQTQFTKTTRRGPSTPPADMLKRQRDN